MHQFELVALHRLLRHVVHLGVAQVVRVLDQRRVQHLQERQIRSLARTQALVVQDGNDACTKNEAIFILPLC